MAVVGEALGVGVPARRRAGEVANFCLPLLVFLALWEGVSRSGAVEPVLLPPPTAVFRALVEASLPGEGPEAGFLLPRHVLRSGARALAGFSLALGAGVVFGILIGASRLARDFFTPLLSVMLAVPTLALTPLLMLVLGLGDRTTIAVSFLAAVFPVAYNALSGVRSLRKEHLWVIRSLGASRWDIFRKVYLPGALVFIITGAKVGAARAWRSLVAAEMLAATSWGLGFMIVEASEYMQTEVIYAAMVTLSGLGLLTERGLLASLERYTTRKWGLLRA